MFGARSTTESKPNQHESEGLGVEPKLLGWEVSALTNASALPPRQTYHNSIMKSIRTYKKENFTHKGDQNCNECPCCSRLKARWFHQASKSRLQDHHSIFLTGPLFDF